MNPDALARALADVDPSAALARARVGRNAWWRYLAAGLLAIGVAFAVAVVATLGLIFAGVAPGRLVDAVTSAAEPAPFMAAVGLQFVVLLLAFWGSVRLVQKKRFGDVAGAWSWRGFLTGAGAWAALLVLLALVAFAADPASIRFSAGRGTVALAIGALLALPVQTFAEEWVFRGWLTQGLLLATKRTWSAVALSALLFGLVHIPNGAPQAISAAMFGAAASLVAIRHGGLAFVFGMHLVNNLFGAVVVVVSGDVFKGAPALFTSDMPPGPLDIVGTAVLLAAITWVAFRTAPAERAPT